MNADNKTCFHSFFYVRGIFIDKFNVFYLYICIFDELYDNNYKKKI